VSVRRLGLDGGACNDLLEYGASFGKGSRRMGDSVPDLVVFEVFERHSVQPVEFFDGVLVQGEEVPGPVDPRNM
jgi:hypothetical protein